MLKKSKLLACYAVVLFVLAVLSISGYAAMSESEPNNTFETATVIPADYNFTEPINGSMSGVSDDYYAFTPTSTGGYQVVINGIVTTGTLYNSQQQTLDQGSVYESSKVTLIGSLTAGQTYYIKIKYSNYSTNNYTINISPVQYSNITTTETEYNDSFLSSNIIPNNQKYISINAAINVAGDTDYFMFTPKISGTYTIESTGSTDTKGYLYDNKGISNGIMNPGVKLPLASDEDGNTSNFSITYNLSASTTYYIKVAHFNPTGSGNYNLVVSIPQEILIPDAEEDIPALPHVLTVGSVYTGQMSSSTDVDYYVFSAPVSGCYRVETKSFNNTTGQIYTVNADPQLLADDDINQDNVALEINCTAQIAYIIRITDVNGATGNYTISVTRGKVLNVPSQSQQPYNALCWATCASMMNSYYSNSNINNTLQIGNPNNLLPHEFNIQKQMEYISNAVSSQITGYEQRHINPSFYPIDYRDIHFYDITKAIDMSAPVTALISNHYIVVKGYSYHMDGLSGEYIIYNDPWDGTEHYASMADFYLYSWLYYIPTHEGNVEYEVNDSFFSSDALNLNEEKFASLNSEGDVDIYRIPLSPGNYTVETFGNTDTIGEVYKYSINPIINYSSISLIDLDDNSGSNGNFKINFVTDTYSPVIYIKVKHSSTIGTGDYSIKVTPN